MKVPKAAHIPPFRLPARRNGRTVLFRSDIDTCSIQIDPLQLRGKWHFSLRYNADFTAPLATRVGRAHGGSSFVGGFIRTQRARRCARCILPNGITWPSRVTNDVGAFLRNHANGRAQGTNEGSVSSTHCVLPLLLQTAPEDQVTSCCSAAKRRNLANG